MLNAACLNVIMLNAIMLNELCLNDLILNLSMLNVFMLNVLMLTALVVIIILLNVHMLNLIMLNAFMLNVMARGTIRMENKFAQILEKVAQTVAKAKNYKISKSKLDLKVQNVYMKSFFTLKIPTTNNIFTQKITQALTK